VPAAFFRRLFAARARVFAGADAWRPGRSRPVALYRLQTTAFPENEHPGPHASEHMLRVAVQPGGHDAPQLVKLVPRFIAQVTELPVTQPPPHASSHAYPVGW
jgi:hypothetical protein